MSAGPVTEADDSLVRCPWSLGSAEYRRYHDEEWGVPCRDGRKLFEFLILEGAQAGLSWSTILAKRENYREAFDGFDVVKVARHSDARIDKLLANPGIVRNRLKVESARSNARAWLALEQDEGRPFADWLWAFVDDTPVVNRPTRHGDVPARTELSDAISKALIKRGFRFVGSTIVYAYLQAMGLVCDHPTSCHCHPLNRGVR